MKRLGRTLANKILKEVENISNIGTEWGPDDVSEYPCAIVTFKTTRIKEPEPNLFHQKRERARKAYGEGEG